MAIRMRIANAMGNCLYIGTMKEVGISKLNEGFIHVVNANRKLYLLIEFP